MSWIVALAAAYLLVVLACWLWQDRLIYFPGPPSGSPPASATLDLRETWIGTPDGERLHAWLARPLARGAGGAPDPAVLVCHGNGGNLAMRLPLAEVFGAMGRAVLLFDYRGYGASSGKPDEEGTYVDAEAAYDFLAAQPDVDAGRIALFGESLGGAVAVELARRRGVSKLVVESTFTSLADVGRRAYPWLPVRAILRARYDSVSKVGSLDVPLLVIHSPEDDVVPYELGRRLFETAREPKRFLSTAGRHDGWGFASREAWQETVRGFLEGDAPGGG